MSSSPITDLADLRARASSSLTSDSTQRVRKAWVVKSLLSLLDFPTDQIGAKAAELVSSLVSKEKIKTLNASTARVSEIVDLFALEMSEKPWKPTTEAHDVPDLLILCLRNLKAAFYDDDSEATCRIAVDYMMVAAKLCINELHPPAPSRFKKRRTAPPTTLPAPSSTPTPLPIRVFPELELDVIVTTATDDTPPRTETRVTGRADWALGYGRRTDALSGAVLVAVEAKRLETFSQAEAQLLTYLAILRQLRLHAGKINPVVQGFYTDGTQYKFLGITNDGEVSTSRTYDIRDAADMKTVFNFIVTIMVTASRSSPNTSPDKSTRFVQKFHKEVWVKVYNAEETENLEILGEDDGGELQELDDPFV